MRGVSVVALVLLVCAVLVVIGAEWPRISEKLGADALEDRRRSRRKKKFEVLDGGAEEVADGGFAASVERDLANLPVIEEPDPDRK